MIRNQMTDQKPQLFMIHYAGGNGYSFQYFLKYLKDFEVHLLELPGRGKRGNEKLIDNFHHAVADLFDIIIKKLNTQNFIIFGHSMGTFLGLEITYLLQHRGVFPKALVVSGNAGPGIENDYKRHLLPRNSLIKEIEAMGHTSSDLLDNEDWLNYYLPIITADFKIAEENHISLSRKIKSPLYAIMGNQESQVSKITNWKKFTEGNFYCKILPGNHFFIETNAYHLSMIFRFCLSNMGKNET